MHFEILVEDLSGKKALDILVPRIICETDTFVVHPYKGIGKIPKNMRDPSEARHRILLDCLPKLLKGNGKTQAGRPMFEETLIVVCDLDNKICVDFLRELNGILEQCDPRPRAHFCLAIEEGEAWLLGDPTAIKIAYPKCKEGVLNSYVNDSICGTWELLADAVYSGGCRALRQKGARAIGAEKSKWAEEIAPRMNVAENQSPSFRHFRDKLSGLSRTVTFD